MSGVCVCVGHRYDAENGPTDSTTTTTTYYYCRTTNTQTFLLVRAQTREKMLMLTAHCAASVFACSAKPVMQSRRLAHRTRQGICGERGCTADIFYTSDNDVKKGNEWMVVKHRDAGIAIIWEMGRVWKYNVQHTKDEHFQHTRGEQRVSAVVCVRRWYELLLYTVSTKRVVENEAMRLAR